MMEYAWMGLLSVNVFSFWLTWLDKRRAVRKQWRVPEKRFMYLAFLGGGLGVYAGCRLFRHKTNRSRFMVGIPLISTIELLTLAVLVWYLSQGPQGWNLP